MIINWYTGGWFIEVLFLELHAPTFLIIFDKNHLIAGVNN